MISNLFDSDPGLVVLSFVWIFAVILVGEGVRRIWKKPPELTRKVIHVGVAFWVLPTALWFDSMWWAAATPAVFIFLNTLSYRYRLMNVIEEEGRGSPGTIYFPISFVLLILVLWPVDARAASVAGILAMGFGDAAASVVGRRWGRNPFLGEKTREGTAAMFGFALVSILLGTGLVLGRIAWVPSVGAALAATVAEAPAGKGMDNLTVPAAGAMVFWGLERLVL